VAYTTMVARKGCFKMDPILHHIGIAVLDHQKILPLYETALGFSLEVSAEYENYGLKSAMLKKGGSRIELLEPLGEQGLISAFIKQKGEAIHHIGFVVDDVKQAYFECLGLGLRLIPDHWSESMDGFFIHPKSTNGVLIEIGKSGEEK
jgi:methylmalonyl-CoA epimerase